MTDVDTFHRKGWKRQPYRILCGRNKPEPEWRTVATGWVNLSFGLCAMNVETQVGTVTVASVTHLPTGRHLMLFEELTDGALAAEIAETVMPEEIDANSLECATIGDQVKRVWDDAGFVSSRVGNYVRHAVVLHLASADPPSTYLLRTVIRHALNQETRCGEFVWERLAGEVASDYPELTAGIEGHALVGMFEEQFTEKVFDLIQKKFIDEDLAKHGLTREMVEAQAEKIMQQTDDDKEGVRRLSRWLNRKCKTPATASDHRC